MELHSTCGYINFTINLYPNLMELLGEASYQQLVIAASQNLCDSILLANTNLMDLHFNGRRINFTINLNPNLIELLGDSILLIVLVIVASHNLGNSILLAVLVIAASHNFSNNILLTNPNLIELHFTSNHIKFTTNLNQNLMKLLDNNILLTNPRQTQT